MADREDVIRKVQALWAQADHPNTSDAEREAFVAKAREMMAKHQIDELVLSEAQGVDDAIVMSYILLFEVDETTLVPDQRMVLIHHIARHTRCKGVITTRNASVDPDGSPIKAGRYFCLIGAKTDVDLVRMMYQEIATHMIVMLTMEPTDHLKKRELANYQVNFCDGYVDRVDTRLADISRVVEKKIEGDGSLLPVLQSRAVAIEDRVNREFPQMGKPVQLKRFTYDPNAQSRGRAAADNANIGGGRGKVGGGTKGAIES